jgi:hypothetical protein
MGADIDGFVVRWDHEVQSLQGFKIEKGDDIEDVALLMATTGFDPDGIDRLSGGVNAGKTKKSLRKRRGNDFAPLPTVSDVVKAVEDAMNSQPRWQPLRAGAERIW